MPMDSPNQAFIKKYVVKGLPYAVAPSTLAGRVLGPLGRLEIFGSGCAGQRTWLGLGLGIGIGLGLGLGLG